MRFHDSTYLKTSTLVSKLPESVKHNIYDLFADGVVPASVVVRRVFLASDKLFWMKQLTVCARTDLICGEMLLLVARYAPGCISKGKL